MKHKQAIITDKNLILDKELGYMPRDQHEKVQNLRAERDHYRDTHEKLRAFAKLERLGEVTKNAIPTAVPNVNEGSGIGQASPNIVYDSYHGWIDKGILAKLRGPKTDVKTNEPIAQGWIDNQTNERMTQICAELGKAQQEIKLLKENYQRVVDAGGIPVSELDQVIELTHDLIQLVEGVCCKNWSADHLRLKDTKEWCRFYVYFYRLKSLLREEESK